LLAARGIADEVIAAVCYENALAAYGRSGRFEATAWAETAIDQRQSHAGNSVLRGQTPVVGA
jgi:hypothetical protein